MKSRIKYELEGKKLPSLSTVLDNCKIGGIGNLIYRAKKDGFAGKDTTRPDLCAFESIKAFVRKEPVDLDEYSDNCADKANSAICSAVDWCDENHVSIKIKDLSLVSDSLFFGHTFDLYNVENNVAIIQIVNQSGIYPENLIKLAACRSLLDNNDLASADTAYILRVCLGDDGKAALEVHEYDDVCLEQATIALVQIKELYAIQEKLKCML